LSDARDLRRLTPHHWGARPYTPVPSPRACTLIEFPETSVPFMSHATKEDLLRFVMNTLYTHAEDPNRNFQSLDQYVNQYIRTGMNDWMKVAAENALLMYAFLPHVRSNDCTTYCTVEDSSYSLRLGRFGKRALEFYDTVQIDVCALCIAENMYVIGDWLRTCAYRWQSRTEHKR
jgi:hypothetical protein